MSRLPEQPTGVSRGSVGGGRVALWRGGSLWVSRETGLVQPHAHHAIQITLAPAGPVRMRGVDSSAWQLVSASIVLPDKVHQFDGGGQDVVMVFVEPETVAGRMLLDRFGDATVALIENDVVLHDARLVLEALAGRAADEALVGGAKRIVERLVGEVPEAAAVDPRVTRAIEWMRDHLGTPVTLAQAAAVAHLSPGRFRHLFVAQTGISFRAYLLWARMNTAMLTGMSGESWTSAAQLAGFADSAHLTRTCRRMFGIAPTMLSREEGAPAA